MRVVYYVVAGSCACFVGVGLSRFAYAPLIPEIIRQQWFNESQAAYLGASNLGGYLIGAFFSFQLASKMGGRNALRVMMLMASATFLASAFPLSFGWYFFWRLVSGIAGGVLLVVSATNVVAVVPAARRGVASGVVLTGVGMGVLVSAILVPALVSYGLKITWLLFGGISGLLTLLTWWGWPPEHVLDAQKSGGNALNAKQTLPPCLTALYKLCLVYALAAAGLVPHMVFLVDFIDRDLGRGLVEGAFYWGLFGLGALIGPVGVGRIADWIGFQRALLVGVATICVSVGLIVLSSHFFILGASSFSVGALVPGIVTLAVGRTQELAGSHMPTQRKWWGRVTTAFAILQAVAAYGYSFWLSQGGSYTSIFISGLIILLCALAVEFIPVKKNATT